MKTRLLQITAISAILLAVPSTVSGIPADPDIDDRPYRCPLGVGGRVLSSVAMNGAAATRTFTFGPKACGRRIDSFRFIVFEAEFTHTTNGNIVHTFTHGLRGASANKTPTVCAGAGTCTQLAGGIFSWAVTGNSEWSGRLGIRGYPVWKLVISHDNTPAAGDLMNVSIFLTD